ncbi:hypothetical protein [Brachyspira alvinipulli]|uniref:hypothetical protein n=1 Tax=Brachyspira alvinipulli TaxID=84379 RepID=UPI003CCBB3E1
MVNIRMPNSLMTVQGTCFDGCSSLKNIEYLETSPNIIKTTTLSGTTPTDLYLPNVPSNPNNNSWDNFLGVKWVNIHYGASMPK